MLLAGQAGPAQAGVTSLTNTDWIGAPQVVPEGLQVIAPPVLCAELTPYRVLIFCHQTLVIEPLALVSQFASETPHWVQAEVIMLPVVPMMSEPVMMGRLPLTNPWPVAAGVPYVHAPQAPVGSTVK